MAVEETARATDAAAPHPLIGRLLDEGGARWVAAAQLEGYAAAQAASVLFFTGDPKRHGETLDIAVILPEIGKALAARGQPFAVGIVPRADEAALQARFGVPGFPSLVFLRNGRYQGTISGVLDWAPLVQEVVRILASEPSRPPSIGIPLASGTGGATCH